MFVVMSGTTMGSSRRAEVVGAESGHALVFPLSAFEIAQAVLVNFGDAGQCANVFGVLFNGYQ